MAVVCEVVSRFDYLLLNFTTPKIFRFDVTYMATYLIACAGRTPVFIYWTIIFDVVVCEKEKISEKELIGKYMYSNKLDIDDL